MSHEMGCPPGSSPLVPTDNLPSQAPLLHVPVKSDLTFWNPATVLTLLALNVPSLFWVPDIGSQLALPRTLKE
jgi:hypothetical protein